MRRRRRRRRRKRRWLSLREGGVKILSGSRVLITVVQLEVVQGCKRAPEKKNVSVFTIFGLLTCGPPCQQKTRKEKAVVESQRRRGQDSRWQQGARHSCPAGCCTSCPIMGKGGNLDKIQKNNSFFVSPSLTEHTLL